MVSPVHGLKDFGWLIMIAGIRWSMAVLLLVSLTGTAAEQRLDKAPSTNRPFYLNCLRQPFLSIEIQSDDPQHSFPNASLTIVNPDRKTLGDERSKDRIPNARYSRLFTPLRTKSLAAEVCTPKDGDYQGILRVREVGKEYGIRILASDKRYQVSMNTALTTQSSSACHFLFRLKYDAIGPHLYWLDEKNVTVERLICYLH